MQYVVVPDVNLIDTWRSEAIEYPEGLCYVVIFSGPNAETRAREYAAWKNADDR